MQDICLVRDLAYLNHDPQSAHPENPGRLKPLLAALADSDLPTLAPRPADHGALLRVHAREMIETVLSSKGKRGWFDTDTYYRPESADTALLAAGSAIDLATAIWRGDYRRGFTLVRPPGHHATPTKIMGFCLFNNVALAAAAVRSEKPGARIAIVDFDLHHGNGTQWAFYDDPDVLFLSSHRYPFYPGTGALEEIGNGKGKGTTVNFPVPGPAGDAFFRSLYRDVAAPIIRAFAPDFILVSAGFDGHRDDPMEGFRMTTETFDLLADLLISLAEERNGKILFVLEGGYDPDALAASALATIRRMTDAPRARFAPMLGSGETAEGVDAFRAFHAGVFREILA